MRNYEEIAERVFRRSEEIIERNNKRRRVMTRVCSAAGCLAVAGAVGVGVWANANNVLSGGQFANDGHDHSGGTDTVTGSTDNENSGHADNHLSHDMATVDTFGGFGDTPYSYCYPPEYVSIVDRYKTDDTACYAIPENGQCFFSIPLRRAMEDYGGKDDVTYLYHVNVEFFKDGQRVDVNSPEIHDGEWDRLSGEGLQCEFALYSSEWSADASFQFVLMLTAEELESFPASDSYGYMIFLLNEGADYGEDEDETVSSNVIFNGC